LFAAARAYSGVPGSGFGMLIQQQRGPPTGLRSDEHAWRAECAKRRRKGDSC